MKKRTVLLFTAILLLSTLLSACNMSVTSDMVTQATISNNTEIMPKNVLQIGESFEYYPDNATGHFLCTVTGARVVTEESECPPRDCFYEYDSELTAQVNGEWVLYDYEEWFTEGGAFDQGCRIVMVDLELTNVDAVAALDDGTFTSSCGYFFDPYAFHAYFVGDLVDLTEVTAAPPKYQQYTRISDIYFSRYGEYAKEDIIDSLGCEPYAIQILPGATETFTLGFPLDTYYDGSPMDPSTLMFCVDEWNYVEDGVYIDLGLEAEPQ